MSEKQTLKIVNDDVIDLEFPQYDIAREINLNERGIETIENIKPNHRLRRVMVAKNKLKNVNGFSSVEDISFLNASKNEIDSNGLEGLKAFTKMVTLNLAGNKIEFIETEYLKKMRKLSALVLNDNRITTFDWMPKLKYLNTLVLSGNGLLYLSEDIILNMPGLTKISLSHNKLKEVPNFSGLKKLLEVRLSNNEISVVPETLANVGSLKLLELKNNRVDTWDNIKLLSEKVQLKQLTLKGNPICGVAMEDNKEDEGDDEALKQERKEADKKNKLYNRQMNVLFPDLIVKDGLRVVNKKTHGFVAPPKVKKVVVKKRKAKNKNEEEAGTDSSDKVVAVKVKKSKVLSTSKGPKKALYDANEAKKNVRNKEKYNNKRDKKRAAALLNKTATIQKVAPKTVTLKSTTFKADDISGHATDTNENTPQKNNIKKQSKEEKKLAKKEKKLIKKQNKAAHAESTLVKQPTEDPSGEKTASAEKPVKRKAIGSMSKAEKKQLGKEKKANKKAIAKAAKITARRNKQLKKAAAKQLKMDKRSGVVSVSTKKVDDNSTKKPLQVKEIATKSNVGQGGASTWD